MRRLGGLLMMTGTAFFVVALSLFVMNQWADVQAEQACDTLLIQLHGESPDDSGELPDPYDFTMTEQEVDGQLCIGYLTVPVLELELPVLSQWSYEKLRVAPCRYYGSTKSDDLVLMAHNYRSHFGRLNTLKPGDMVLFTDMDLIVHDYQVIAVDVLEPTATEEMTDGAYDLTLFTCTYGGGSRVTVRCDRVSA